MLPRLGTPGGKGCTCHDQLTYMTCYCKDTSLGNQIFILQWHYYCRVSRSLAGQIIISEGMKTKLSFVSNSIRPIWLSADNVSESFKAGDLKRGKREIRGKYSWLVEKMLWDKAFGRTVCLPSCLLSIPWTQDTVYHASTSYDMWLLRFVAQFCIDASGWYRYCGKAHLPPYAHPFLVYYYLPC